MSGTGARLRRQEKRAGLFDRGLIVREDLAAVVGMTLEAAQIYAKDNKLRIRLYCANKEEKTKDVGPDAITVKLIDGIIVNAKTNRNFND